MRYPKVKAKKTVGTDPAVNTPRCRGAFREVIEALTAMRALELEQAAPESGGDAA